VSGQFIPVWISVKDPRVLAAVTAIPHAVRVIAVQRNRLDR
jgi:hypothetical protein